MQMDGMMSPGFHVFGFFLWAVFWVLVVLGVYFIVRGTVGCRAAGTGGGGRALDVLNERYAKGEITKEEYNEKKKDILGG